MSLNRPTSYPLSGGIQGGIKAVSVGDQVAHLGGVRAWPKGSLLGGSQLDISQPNPGDIRPLEGCRMLHNLKSLNAFCSVLYF